MLSCVLLQLDREKIPERVVHARGMVAKGYFEVGVAFGFNQTNSMACCRQCVA